MDRNLGNNPKIYVRNGSLSARRAWIEILLFAIIKAVIFVALRKESVDRNQQSRNGQNIKRHVALRKESVDRNSLGLSGIDTLSQSLSARRAWIEISLLQCQVKKYSGRSPQGERG